MYQEDTYARVLHRRGIVRLLMNDGDDQYFPRLTGFLDWKPGMDGVTLPSMILHTQSNVSHMKSSSKWGVEQYYYPQFAGRFDYPNVY